MQPPQRSPLATGIPRPLRALLPPILLFYYVGEDPKEGRKYV